MPIFRRDKETARFSTEPVTADYTGRLAFIGRRLDEAGCRSVTVVEFASSYIVRAIRKEDDEVYVTEIVPEDFERGDVRLPHKPQPSSYEAMFRALGKDFDARIAANIAILEGPTTFQIVGWERGFGAGSLAHVPFELAFDRPSLYRLAEEHL